MVRPYSSDHVMYQECIEVFRPEKTQTIGEKENVGFILLNFELKNEWDFGKFKISPTREVSLGGIYHAFIAPIVWFEPIESDKIHLVAIAIGSLVSFIVSRPVKTARDSFFMTDIDTDEGLKERGMYFPIKQAGTGFTNTQISKERIEQYYTELLVLTKLLYKIPYSDYKRFMQAIRLVNLGHNNKREEFSLSYYLLVSAIESIAQLAIPIERPKDPKEDEWEELAKSNKAVKSLLGQYKSLRDSGNQLTKRFGQFILKYCPIDEWELHEHPLANAIDTYLSEFKADQLKDLTKKQWYEILPEELKPKEIKIIIEDTYKYRSKFTHEGGPTPHSDPNASERFFETLIVVASEAPLRFEKKLLIKHDFLSFIAKSTILKYLRQSY
ncbi:hypothetical protein J5Y03_16500 [Bacillus sp. RG28]|uniref:Uncharacterized protein n=1 Tax=Gottfriedia endophytica TaxID=2820819 RepID=A0A940NLP1_9BACI|nr:hypothetical protein [Gottfriedia endophytica]MBP0726760.1 hypothetical protein [Gottfriedia endophytica]